MTSRVAPLGSARGSQHEEHAFGNFVLSTERRGQRDSRRESEVKSSSKGSSKRSVCAGAGDGESPHLSPQPANAAMDLKLRASRARKRTMVRRARAEKIKLFHEDGVQHPFVLAWDSRFRQCWDVVAVAFVLYLTYKIPLGVAFSGAWEFPAWMDSIMTVYFLVDIVLNFRTGFLHAGHHVTDPKLIRAHYLKFWFWVDVFASIPFEKLLQGAMDPTARKSLKMLKWLKFPKLLRLGRFLRYLKSNVKYYNLFVLCVISVFCVHISACIYASKVNPCIDLEQLDVDGGVIVYCTPEQMTSYYLSSVYVATLMLLNALDGTQFARALLPGESDGSQLLPQGMAVAVAAGGHNHSIAAVPDWINLDPSARSSFLGVIGLCFAVVVVGFALIIQIMAEVVMFSQQRSQAYRAFYHKVGQVKHQMTSANLSEELQYRVARYYDYLWINNKHGRGSSGILQDEDLSDTLKRQIALGLHGELLHRITIFDDCSQDCICDIAMRLSLHVYMPGDVLFVKGARASKMYLVRAGQIHIHVPIEDEKPEAVAGPAAVGSKSKVMVMGEGSFFGELALLTDQPRACDASSFTMSELNELSKKDFHEVMVKFPELSEEVVEEVSALYPHLRAQIEQYAHGAPADSAAERPASSGASASAGATGAAAAAAADAGAAGRVVTEELIDRKLAEMEERVVKRIAAMLEKQGPESCPEPQIRPLQLEPSEAEI